MDRLWTIPLATLTILAVSVASSLAQIPQKADITLFRGVRCLIQTQRPQWDRNTGTVVSGTIENLADGPVELEAEPELLLISKASSKLSDRFWAPVDLLRDVPIGINKRPLDPKRRAVSIESQPILLQFKSKGDVFHFPD
jgi:hypothetical protein